MSHVLLVTSHQSFGEALDFANQALENANIELLEAIPMGSKGQVILKGKASDLEKLSSGSKSFSLITKHVDKVLNCYYNLELNDIQNELCVLESEQPEDLFLAMSEFFDLNWKCVDLRIPRSGKSCGYLLMTGEKHSDTTNNFGRANLKIKPIFKVNPRLKDYYNLSVKD